MDILCPLPTPYSTAVTAVVHTILSVNSLVQRTDHGDYMHLSVDFYCIYLAFSIPLKEGHVILGGMSRLHASWLLRSSPAHGSLFAASLGSL